MRQISVNVCLSIGMTMIIVAGGIDLSVGSILALAGAVTAGLIKNPVPIPWLDIQLEFTVGGGILAGLAVGMLLGWFNGQMITRVRIPPFVATLGMLSIARGLDDAVDQRISDYRVGYIVCHDRHGQLSWRPRSGLDFGVVIRRVHRRDEQDSLRPLHLCRRRERASRRGFRVWTSIGSSDGSTRWLAVYQQSPD